MELFPEQIPSSGSFYFFFSCSFQHLLGDLSVLRVASWWQIVLASLGSLCPEEHRGQGLCGDRARQHSLPGGTAQTVKKTPK